MSVDDANPDAPGDGMNHAGMSAGKTAAVRKVCQVYSDPLDLIWIHAARQMGLRVTRSSLVNASWDGRGTLTIGTPDTLDPDDCVAQMILHEICHALCEGPDCLTLPDWGLESFDPTKKVHEHACLRLQAALADLHGMRSFFAATTIFRRYYDRIPADPLADEADPAVLMARRGWIQAVSGPWSEPLQSALQRTAAIAALLSGCTTAASLWHAQPHPTNVSPVAGVRSAASSDL